MARWFRSYEAKLDNPKVQRLPDALYRAWDSLLCVTSRYDGVLPSLEDCAFLLRKSPEAMAELLEALIEARLFVRTERGIVPHDWNVWQYKSDISTERVKRFRERRASVAATPSESDTDTESDTDSVANATGAGAPSVKDVFDEGVKLLTGTGTSESHACSIIGRSRRGNGDEAVFAGLQAAGRPRRYETWDQRRIREALAALDETADARPSAIR